MRSTGTEDSVAGVVEREIARNRRVAERGDVAGRGIEDTDAAAIVVGIVPIDRRIVDRGGGLCVAQCDAAAAATEVKNIVEGDQAATDADAQGAVYIDTAAEQIRGIAADAALLQAQLRR